jgi:hypothetical protein
MTVRQQLKTKAEKLNLKKKNLSLTQPQEKKLGNCCCTFSFLIKKKFKKYINST